MQIPFLLSPIRVTNPMSDDSPKSDASKPPKAHPRRGKRTDSINLLNEVGFYR